MTQSSPFIIKPVAQPQLFGACWDDICCRAVHAPRDGKNLGDIWSKEDARSYGHGHPRLP